MFSLCDTCLCTLWCKFRHCCKYNSSKCNVINNISFKRNSPANINILLQHFKPKHCCCVQTRKCKWLEEDMKFSKLLEQVFWLFSVQIGHMHLNTCKKEFKRHHLLSKMSEMQVRDVEESKLRAHCISALPCHVQLILKAFEISVSVA